ncbi:MAG: FtsQ-type POTRA domain-containing protein [Acidimicrobiales bacterium]|jgi:cell division protein FtsQ
MTPPDAPTDAPPDAPAVDERPVIDPRIRQRRVAIQRSQGRRRLRWIGGTIAVLVLVTGVVGLLHTPLFSARVVSVSGVHPHTTDAAILAAAGLDHQPPLISVDPGATAERVEALPFIATAQVHRHWPDGVTVTVTERVPKVVVAGPGASWSVLDAYGRTLEVLPAQPPGLVVLAVAIAGGAAHPAAVGGTLGPGGSFGLIVCRTLPPAFSAQVVSVTEAANATVSLGLNSGITVLLGTDTDMQAKYEDVAAVIAHASLRGATTIDVTVPESPTVTG